jgi:ABC-type branched-subunit amino acid transport system permease subunit
MMYGGESEQVENQLRRIWHKFMVFSPSTPGLQLAQQAALVHLANMADSRRLRLLCAKKALPGIMWFVLLTGAVITLFFCFLFGAPNLRAQSMMSALLTIMISLTLLLILRMDHIFVGSHGLKPEAFQFSIEHMNRLLPEEKAQSR